MEKEITFRTLLMCAFYDKKSHQYDTPFFVRNELSAKRHFHIVSEKNDIIKTFLDDFDLYHLGEFGSDGHFKSDERLIMEGKDLKAQKGE